MTHEEFIAIGAQLKRGTRNIVLLSYVDEAERLAHQLRAMGAGKVPEKVSKPADTSSTAKRDRAEYMRRYRASVKKDKP